MYKDIIPIIFGTDIDYVFPTGVTVASILKNSLSTTYYDIFILTTEIAKESCEVYLKELKKKYSNFNISYILMDQNLFKNVNVTNPHVSAPTYYRLLSAEILKQYDKCICLDSDIMVNQDLSELFRIDMEDNYIAGVKSWDDQQLTENNKKHMLSDGLASMDQYVYLGVLVMNLKQIRDDAMTRLFIEHMNRGYRSDDQDVFNICCYNKIVFLPVKYNLLLRFYRIQMPDGCSVYPKNELQEAWNDPVILHFPGRLIKPWLNLRVREADKWWEYATIFNHMSEYKHYYKISRSWSKGIDWSTLISKIDTGMQVVIFGFSEIGMDVFDALKRSNIHNIICFCDNDKSKQGKCYKGTTVYPISELQNYTEPIKIVITSQLYSKNIKEQLESSGIKSTDILEYTNKSKIYYRAIHKNYYETELKELYIKEYGLSPSNEYGQLLLNIKQNSKLIDKYGMNEWLFASDDNDK